MKNQPYRPFRIYQVELSAHCNMKCHYCPHPGMERKKGHMSEEVLRACIEWSVSTGAERMVLHHFGDPLVHPKLQSRLQMIAAAGLRIQFSTNGLLLDKAWGTLVELQSPVKVMLAFHQWVSRPEQDYLEVLHAYQKRAVGTAVEVVPAYAFKEQRYALHHWAKGDRTEWDAQRCPFIRQNLGVVLWNGDIVSCCVDHEGKTAKANILDPDAHERVSQAWHACGTCDVGRLMQDEDW